MVSNMKSYWWERKTSTVQQIQFWYTFCQIPLTRKLGATCGVLTRKCQPYLPIWQRLSLYHELSGNPHLNPKRCFFLLFLVLPHSLSSFGYFLRTGGKDGGSAGGPSRRDKMRVTAQFTASTCLSVLPQPLIQLFSLPPLLTFCPLVCVPWADFHHPIRNNTLFLLPASLGTLGSKPPSLLPSPRGQQCFKERGRGTTPPLRFLSVWTASIALRWSVTQWFIKHTNNEWICSISEATCWSQTFSAELGEREQQNAYISWVPRPYLMAC